MGVLDEIEANSVQLKESWGWTELGNVDWTEAKSYIASINKW